MEYPTYESKPASHNSMFDGAKEVAEYDRNLRMRALGAAESRGLDAPNVALSGVKSIDAGASDFRLGSKDAFSAYNDRKDQEAETRLIDGAERSRRYAEELQAQRLEREGQFRPGWLQEDLRARIEMAERIRMQEQQERKEHKKSWSKYMPW